MKCHRCNGEMIEEKFYDLMDDTGKFNFNGWRCMICGDILDAVISSHRKHLPLPLVGKKRKAVVAVN